MAEILAVRQPSEISRVVRLARQIWMAHYSPIIGPEQVAYMLDRFQSETAVSRQIADGQDYFLLQDQGEDRGYLALVPDPAQKTLMISKIYVLAADRGKGYGRQLLAFSEDYAREQGLLSLWLTVNRHNQASIDWYQQSGFENSGAVVQDIGGGFVMDDYRFEKVV